MEKLIPVGEKAAHFRLPVGNGKLEPGPDDYIDLTELHGSNVILAFYPADWSDVCSSQIALYNELIPTFAEYDAQVFGISVDGTFCHKAFKEAHNMSITLLCDFEPKGEMSRLYGAYNEDIGISNRILYVIDKQGIVQYAYKSPNEENPGAKEILETLKSIKNVY